MQITDRDLIAALRRMAPETGSLLCLGCGYERKCSVHGCAVLRTAVDRLKELTAPPPNPVKDCKAILSALRPPEAAPRPLTLEELREMDGEPVFVISALGEQAMWYIVDVEENELKNPWDRISLEDWDEGYPYKAYRRKPEEGTI